MAIKAPDHSQAPIGLGMATDLGGNAIMVGGTNGAHLTSFSLVYILSHGRACALMNPYYAVFFAPAIEESLRRLGQIYRKHGYSNAVFSRLKGRDLGIAFAEAMFAFAKEIHFPVKLSDIEGFSQQHIERALEAAKNPQLQSKLENMPVPLTVDMIDDYMAPILEAAKSGDVSLIRNV